MGLVQLERDEFRFILDELEEIAEVLRYHVSLHSLDDTLEDCLNKLERNIDTLENLEE